MRVDQVRERRERRESLLWIMLVILLLTCTTIGSINVGTVSGQVAPVIYVNPPTSTAAPTETFSVNIKVANITVEESLYGWEFRMSFNTTVLDAVSVVEGPFLKNINSTFFKKKINNTEGTVNALATLIPPYPEVGAVGNGTLCTITFKVEAKGATFLHLDSTELYTVIGGSVSSPIEHTAEDGFFETLTVHDVAVTSLDAPTKATLGDLVSINVTVANEGDFNETLTVTVSYDSTEIDTTTFTLNEGLSKTVEFSWNTTGLGVGVYTINATATITLDEDPGDNFKTTTIEIKPYVFTVTGPGWEFNVIVDSNSSVSSFEFRQGDKEIKFSVTGPEGTAGFCNVTIPTGLMTGPWIIFINGVVTSPIQSGNGTHTFLYFTYTHSTKNVIIRGTWVVPEFPTLIPMLLTLAFLAVSTIVLKRKTGNNC